MPAYPGFMGPAYQSSSYMADSERLINYYPEQNQSPSAPAPWVFQPTPGFASYATVTPSNGCRGLFSTPTRAFWVSGALLLEVFDGGTYVTRGTVATASTPVTMCWSGPAGGELFITSGGKGYIYNLGTDAFATVLTSGADQGGYLDGYFLALDAATGTLQVSDLLDGLTWDVTQIAQNSASADPWVAMHVIHADIWLFGSQTSQVWYDAGTFPFPFAMRPEVGVIEQGTPAAYSASHAGIALAWLGQDQQGRGVVWRAEGYVPQKISTPAIEAAIQSYGDLSGTISFSYQENGHYFYVLNFPDRTSWTYDVTTQLWHERAYWNVATAAWEPLRAWYVMSAFNQLIAGDTATGTLYTMASTTYTDVGGAPLRRLRQPPRLAIDQTRFIVDKIQLVMDVGIGLANGQGSNPQVLRQTSRDGGRTWGPGYLASAGAAGAYGTRVLWRQCGQARNRVDRFIVSDPVPWRLVDAVIQVRPGVS